MKLKDLLDLMYISQSVRIVDEEGNFLANGELHSPIDPKYNEHTVACIYDSNRLGSPELKIVVVPPDDD